MSRNLSNLQGLLIIQELNIKVTQTFHDVFALNDIIYKCNMFMTTTPSDRLSIAKQVRLFQLPTSYA